MKRNSKVSTAVIRRLPRYYRQLSELQRKGVVRISSSALYWVLPASFLGMASKARI